MVSDLMKMELLSKVLKLVNQDSKPTLSRIYKVMDRANDNQGN